MDEKLTGTASVTINTTADKVWEALVTPELIKKYFFGTEAHSDWEPGSPLTFTGEWEGKKYEDKGEILKKEPMKLLQFSYWSSMTGKPDIPENYAHVTYRLSPEGSATRLTVTQDNIGNEEGKAQSEQNWNTVLNSLKKLLESGDTK